MYLTINEILLFGLTDADYSRISFWRKHEKESGYSGPVFWRKLNDSWEYYSKKIESEIELRNSWGNDIHDFGIALIHETRGKLLGHINRIGLAQLKDSLRLYGLELGLFIYYYEFDHSNIHSAFHASPWKEYQDIKTMNELSFKIEYLKTDVKDLDEYFNFHYRCFKRKHEKSPDWETKRNNWFEETKKNALFTKDFRHKDAFLNWLEKMENDPVISKVNPGQKKSKPKDVFSQRQIAIACFFLGIQLTKENGREILKKYGDSTSVQKLLSKRISKASELALLSESKTRDTKHLKDLEAAKRLISGKKDRKAIKDINAVIAAFQQNYKAKY